MNKRVLSIALSALFFAAPAWAMNEELEKTGKAVRTSYCVRYKLMGSKDNDTYLEETYLAKKLRKNNNDNTDTSSLENLFDSPTEALMEVVAQEKHDNANE